MLQRPARRAAVVVAVLVAYTALYAAARPVLLHAGWGAFAAVLVAVNALCGAAIFSVLRISVQDALLGLSAVLIYAGAALAGGMYVSCDIAMRPSVVEMVAFLLPITLIVQPLYGGPFIVLSVGASFAVVAVRKHRARSAVTIAAVLAVPLLAAATYGFGRLMGAHPVAGNCVL